ncbi:hypothetical protein GALL_403680 [mine drainage metagenome]|uniref:Uncharacterized protein n=1 Tax=mine drainage metagenome TaxID=410659 RepID=A0A1J5Q2K5_9ZZZZ
MPRVSTSRASVRPAADSSPLSGATVTAGSRLSSAPTRAARRSSRRTLSSTVAAGISPLSTAATSASPHGPSGPGITRSCAAAAERSDRTAVQSEITTPSNPHTPLSGSARRSFSLMVTPPTALYALMTVQVPASTTVRSNGAR